MSTIQQAVFQKRVEKLLMRMKNEGIDCVLVYSDIWRANNVAYLTDYRQGGGGIGQSWTALLLPLEGCPSMFVGFEELGCAKLQKKIEADIYSSERFEEILRNIFESQKVRKIGIAGHPIILHTVYEAIKRVANGAEIINCDLFIAEERWIKTQEEIECIKRATQYNDSAMKLVIDSIREGISEKELLALGSEYLSKHQCELAFIPTVGVGVNSAVAMKRPTDLRVQKGDLILIDYGAIYEGYAADTARTVGFHVADSFKRGILTTALEARAAALDAIKPGDKISNVELAVRNAIHKGGYGDYILHNASHGLGIDSSEEDLPTGLDSELIMKPGMVFTVEPGIYVEGVGGCRIEECVHVTENGCEVFSDLPPDYFIE